MVSQTHMTIAHVAWGMSTSGFRINRYIYKDARRRGDAPIPVIIEEFRNMRVSQRHLPGLSSLSMLEDIVVHQLDIRRPLLRDRSIPEGRMIPVASDLHASRFFPGQKLFLVR
jgi:hypothetical protein